MANPEHVKILKKGVEVWNNWRTENRDIIPGLRNANLKGADLSEINLSHANLHKVMLRGANLRSANLSRTNLDSARLTGSDLNGAFLRWANLTHADLREADLSEANLISANLFGARLNKADLSKCEVGYTNFTYVDLNDVRGLETIRHNYPSFISIDTIYRCKTNIPEGFLRGAGLPDNFIEYMASLAGTALESYSCFISFSSKDEEFVQRLHADLQNENIRCWYAPEDMKIGDKIRTRIDESIRIYDKLLIVLSENSIESDWVEKEVETAFEEETKHKKTILFPIRIDEAVMDTDKAWAADSRHTRHIGDFTKWKDHDFYKKSFQRLVRDLKKSEEAK